MVVVLAVLIMVVGVGLQVRDVIAGVEDAGPGPGPTPRAGDEPTDAPTHGDTSGPAPDQDEPVSFPTRVHEHDYVLNETDVSEHPGLTVFTANYRNLKYGSFAAHAIRGDTGEALVEHLQITDLEEVDGVQCGTSHLLVEHETCFVEGDTVHVAVSQLLGTDALEDMPQFTTELSEAVN